ncbi:hypothetical protein RHGRI_028117 [Rhododendron griersonianum]|uniref:Rubisco LSMT substrate-binding domain-containing protein n=1 Tax=Rhododendron griersonianum TaxID=479676 RepID=A0AAV6IEG4_9ERIC|nr:hypothetical protein RHGRI_028117 [Rhododendron griersonianum]
MITSDTHPGTWENYGDYGAIYRWIQEKAGDVAFSVPNSLVVTLERVLGIENIEELLATNKLSELACLALYLMYEKKQGKKSFWYPYIRELVRQRGRGQLAVESPLLWTETDLAYLTGSLTKQYPYDIPTEAFPFEIFKQAFVAVQSCVIHLQKANIIPIPAFTDLELVQIPCTKCHVFWCRLPCALCTLDGFLNFVNNLVIEKVSLARRFALVPLGPPLLAYRSNCKSMLTAVDGAVQLVVDRPYNAGEPIVVWCGPQPNSKLLLNYGFVDDDNAFDRLVVVGALNTEDPQYQDKRMVAQRNGKLSVQTFHEKEAVSDMLPYLRLGYVSDPSEMQSVISSQGPICPLADFNLDPKKRVATQLVRLEKKMLNACLKATVDLINQLPDNTVSPCPAPYAPILR